MSRCDYCFKEYECIYEYLGTVPYLDSIWVCSGCKEKCNLVRMEDI